MLKMQPAKPLIVDSMQRLNPTSVLDLGCGKCKFSKKFIENNIPVTGVDKKPTTESEGNFKFVKQNILDFDFNSIYDLIIGTGILHFLEKKDAYRLIKKMQKNTLQRGFHFLICMSNEERPNDKIHFYPNKEVLSKLYSGWEIIHNNYCISKKHGKIMHKHKIIIFLAKKV